MTTQHDEIRDRLANEYRTLPPLECNFCKSLVPLPPGDATRKEFRYVHRPLGVVFIADVAVLDRNGNPVTIIEVIASH